MHKVLIVEDELALLEALGESLRLEGFYVFSARNGEEGLKLALKDKPEVILLDIVMPIMDGLTMLGKLKEDEAGKSITVIMLSNLSEKKDIVEAMSLGAYKYLVKSDIDISEVIEIIKEVTVKK